eukprot:TRINITY_DN12516_c0_g1_i1.p1 TRINITY_DN12516_c0_g1~~TRINITY_DN12516_c0_g1_i1.p1  ORF type:complete len:159 (+),score=6.08 TRINITY_DN12516_c0_g1_i1:219-695(+)
MICFSTFLLSVFIIFHTVVSDSWSWLFFLIYSQSDHLFHHCCSYILLRSFQPRACSFSIDEIKSSRCKSNDASCSCNISLILFLSVSADISSLGLNSPITSVMSHKMDLIPSESFSCSLEEYPSIMAEYSGFPERNRSSRTAKKSFYFIFFFLFFYLM